MPSQVQSDLNPTSRLEDLAQVGRFDSPTKFQPCKVLDRPRNAEERNQFKLCLEMLNQPAFSGASHQTKQNRLAQACNKLDVLPLHF